MRRCILKAAQAATKSEHLTTLGMGPTCEPTCGGDLVWPVTIIDSSWSLHLLPPLAAVHAMSFATSIYRVLQLSTIRSPPITALLGALLMPKSIPEYPGRDSGTDSLNPTSLHILHMFSTPLAQAAYLAVAVMIPGTL